MQKLIIAIALLSFSHLGYGQASLAEGYKKVDQLIWIVEDLDMTKKGWESMGFTQFIHLDTVESESKVTGISFRVIMAKANLGGAYVTWIQPVEGSSIFSEFHDSYGDGVISLVHRFQSTDYQNEIARLSALGIEVLDKITFHTQKGSLDYVLWDTYERGKYVLGITYDNIDTVYRDLLPDNNLHQLRIAQYAFAINEETEVSTYWDQLGFPPVIVEPSRLSNKEYHGKKSDFVIDLAWQRHGSIPYEWVITRKPPTINEDHIDKHGEGFHHLGFLVENIESVIEDFESKGIFVSSGGTWGEEGKPGSGIFKYFNTETLGGVTLELLWPFREP